MEPAWITGKVKEELEFRNDDAVDDGRNNNSLARVNKMLSNFVMYECFILIAGEENEWKLVVKNFIYFRMCTTRLLIKFSEKKP